MARIAMLAVCLTLGACATPYTPPRADDFSSDGPGSRDRLGVISTYMPTETSLFSSDADVLSDAEIARVLDFQYTPPARSRIALLPIGWGNWTGWSEQMALATDDINSALVTRLRSSSRIQQASFLPTLLVPEKRSVPYLREAAARYQADLLLIFRASCRSFERYRLLRADQTRALCAVEAVLLDVRTGLVPFVSNAAKTFEATQNDSDLSFRETVLKSQLDAIGLALGEVSTATVEFLERGR
jgi:hypothetical protein